MKRLFVALAFLPALMGSTCLHTNGPTPPLDGGVTFTNCSDTAFHQTELNILPAVENALASSNWEQALLTIVASVAGPFALQEVNCVVAWVESEATKQSIATADSLEATKAANAAAWLSKHPANITGAMGSP